MRKLTAKLMRTLRMPPSGMTKEARGVAHTMAAAATVMSKVTPKAIHQTFSPRRWSPSDFQPSLEYPSRVTTSSMIKVATTGVHDHTEAYTTKFEARSNMLIDKAAPTARHSTSTEKMAPLLVSASFVNISLTPSLAEEPARRSCLAAGSWWVATPDLGGGQVAVLRLHVASAGHATKAAYSWLRGLYVPRSTKCSTAPRKRRTS